MSDILTFHVKQTPVDIGSPLLRWAHYQIKAIGIGYTDSAMGFDGHSCAVLNAIGKQSSDIAQGVDREEAREQGITGRVLVQFVVNQDGSISDTDIIEGIGFGCDQESIRVILTSALWEPGLKGGEPVKVRLVLPVEFVLESNS